MEMVLSFLYHELITSLEDLNAQNNMGRKYLHDYTREKITPIILLFLGESESSI